MKVQKLMSREVRCCAPHHDLQVPARMMWEGDIGVVAVVDADKHLVGVITDRDIAMAAMLSGRPLRELRVGDTMTRDVVTVKELDSLQTAERAMSSRQVRRLPVIDAAEQVVGMLSMNDLAAAYSNGGGAIAATDLAHMLHAVSRHRTDPTPPDPEAM